MVVRLIDASDPILAGEAALRLDRMLLGLPGGLAAAALGAVLLWRRAPLWIVPLIVGGYALYWSPGRALGARFWHPLYLLLPAPVLTCVI